MPKNKICPPKLIKDSKMHPNLGMDSPQHIEDHPLGFTPKSIFIIFIKILKVLTGLFPKHMPFQKYKEYGSKVNFSS